MPGPFAITPSTSTATLDASRQGTVTFTVKNTTKIRIRGIGRFVATPPESVHWYTIAPVPTAPPAPTPTPSPATGQPTPPVPNVRDFGPEETLTYTVNIAVPPSAAAGDYRFKLVIANEANPDDDFTESTEVGFSIAPMPAPTPSKFPIWIIPVILVILALIIGAIVLLTRDTTPPPPIETETPTPTITSTTAPTRTPTPRPPTITPFPVGDVVIADTGLSGQISTSALSAYGIRRVRGAPLSSYCSDGTVAAVMTGYGSTYLTTATSGNLNRCNTVPILIEFAAPVRFVRLTFWGASVEYEMRVYDADGSLITTVSQEALCCGNLHTVEFQQRAATIGRVEFGYTTAITGVTRIEFRN